MNAPIRELDEAWHRVLRQVAEVNGHRPAALAALPEAAWAGLLAFVVARMSNQGIVPMTGRQGALAARAGRSGGEER